MLVFRHESGEYFGREAYVARLVFQHGFTPAEAEEAAIAHEDHHAAIVAAYRA